MQRTESTRRNFLQLAGGAGMAILAGAPHAAASAAESQAAPAPSTPGRLELGMASYSLRTFPLESAVAMTVRLGLKHICLKDCHLSMKVSPEETAKAADTVRAAGLDLYGCGVIYMKNEKEVNQAFDYAKAAGMKTIVAAPLPNMLPLINEKVKQFDIRVAIHNHGPSDKTYPTPESIYEKIGSLDHRVGLCIDVDHTARTGADPSRDIRRFADRLLDVHLRDITVAAPPGKCIEAGRGVLDLVGIVRALVETKFSGIASFEYEKDPKDPLPGLAESVGYVHGVLAAIR
jgi:inosose dehydratase